MSNKNLIDYIKKLLSQGHSQDQIRDALIKSGWEENQVSESLASIEGGDSETAKFPRFFIKIKKNFLVQNKKLIFSILGIVLVGGFAFASWQIWGTPKETTELSEQHGQKLPSEILEEEFSFQNSDVVAFPAADGQFPFPEYEKMKAMWADEFFPEEERQAEFALAYWVGGYHESAIKSFYVEILEAQGWNIEEDFRMEVYVGEGTRQPVILSFSKPKSELYEISITIQEAESRNPVIEGWPVEVTAVRISHRWPLGFSYAKDLTPNSPFCKYFDRDFKKIIGSVTGGEIKLNGLHELPEDPDWGLTRIFYYISEKKLSFDDIAKIEEAFISNGYKITWTSATELGFSFVEQVTGVNFLFNIDVVGEEDLVIEFLWNLVWDKDGKYH